MDMKINRDKTIRAFNRDMKLTGRSLRIRYNSEFQEFTVSDTGESYKSVACKYFTSDLQDALSTARYMLTLQDM